VPTYSYACTACEHHFDTVQKFTDPSLTDCPECSGRLRKLFSSVGIVFKGSGFYRTDSRSSSSDKPSPNGKSESGAKDKPSSKPSESTSTSESKPVSTSATSAAS
jgi:putative FmdB family regulatory protein